LKNNLSKTYATTAIIAIALASMLVLSPTLASAQKGNPHWVGQARATANSDHSITVTGKIAGLASGSSTTVTLQASSVQVTVQCNNPGGNPPPPKVVSSGAQVTQGTFSADKNGNVQVALTLGPPTVTAEQAQCTNGNNAGWTVQIISVTYSGLTLTSNLAGSTTVRPDPITA
jgi:hypothetical protein